MTRRVCYPAVLQLLAGPSSSDRPIDESPNLPDLTVRRDDCRTFGTKIWKTIENYETPVSDESRRAYRWKRCRTDG